MLSGLALGTICSCFSWLKRDRNLECERYKGAGLYSLTAPTQLRLRPTTRWLRWQLPCETEVGAAFGHVLRDFSLKCWNNQDEQKKEKR